MRLAAFFLRLTKCCDQVAVLARMSLQTALAQLLRQLDALLIDAAAVGHADYPIQGC
jgi:hypothetical protein